MLMKRLGFLGVAGLIILLPVLPAAIVGQ